MNNLLKKLTNIYKGGVAMTINYFAMQIQLDWISLEDVPKRYRAKVKELLELSEIGVGEADKEG